MVASGGEGSGIASTHTDLREKVPAALAPLETENRLFLSHYTANATHMACFPKERGWPALIANLAALPGAWCLNDEVCIEEEHESD